MTTSAFLRSARPFPNELRVGTREYLCPSPWCTSAGKRIFDVFFAIILLIASLPLIVLASLAVLTSGRPLFFMSNRVGLGGRRIRVLKFRTMLNRKELGLQLTRGGDDRVTKVGRFLRKWKIDELPQFLNVVRGDMSLVGPRPDSPEFLDALPEPLHSLLTTVRPGITSVATRMFRNEEELLSRIPEGELTRYYVNTLLPEKVWLDLEYACHATLFTDLKLLFQTLCTVLR